ncbi:hypothetical protein G4Y79_14680 [Phototrophicus methaneseepsis]|uniref:Bacterial transcriptional activator domain-containing protein n=1 Tax=Phototrophicus methaneseepsis TaxID=2710758 RepID=A0A7S8E5W6_9CHLR|nr:BTAD domain-containing putative transcriptional regulator [Phototrophicus methaneseepsis]QPC80951.1 hypothetical protein G4Y79_14680 [Phototrophicus methaneseepsis]
MSLQSAVSSAYDVFLEHAQDAQVVLFHPQSRLRSVLVAQLFQDPNTQTFYYALGENDNNLQSFIEGFAHDMATQHPTFGRHLYMLPYELHQNFAADVDRVLDTIVQEISELSDEPFVLVLDEYDRSDDANDINRFVEYLADRLPEQCTLVINSRTLPRLPWLAMVAKKQAVIIQDDHLITQDIHGPHQHENYNLEVYALGPGFVRLNGEQVDTWEGHLPRLLFFYALDRPVVTRAEICDAFWPNLDTDQAVNVFHVTKRRLHKALDLDVLLHIENYYQINPELTVYYDVVDFVETLMRGRYSTGDEQFQAWQRAVELYKGPFLQGHDETWIVDRREAMRTGYLEAVMGMARTYVERGKGETALKLYRSAIDEDYSREDLHRELMLLYNELGRRGEAVAHYQQVEKIFNENNMTLSPKTIDVYNDIMA